MQTSEVVLLISKGLSQLSFLSSCHPEAGPQMGPDFNGLQVVLTISWAVFKNHQAELNWDLKQALQYSHIIGLGETKSAKMPLFTNT